MLGLDPRPIRFDEREQSLFDVFGPLEVKRIAFAARVLALLVFLPCTSSVMGVFCTIFNAFCVISAVFGQLMRRRASAMIGAYSREELRKN